MKTYVKYLPGFCVTYLHNPFECSKCIETMGADDVEEKFFSNFYVKQEKDQQNPVKKDVPSKYVPKTKKTAAKEKRVLTPLPTSRTQLASKLSKKRCFDGTHLENNRLCSSKSLKKVNKVKTSTKSSKKISMGKHEKTSVKRRQSSKSVQKLSGDKIPGRGTLKRKKWYIEQLKQKDVNHEDDIYEDRKFNHLPNLLEDESDSPDNYSGLQTPIFPFSLSPRERTPSPDYTCFYSPEELNLSRKRGEEYIYRMKKRKKSAVPVEKKKKETETPRIVQESPSAIFERLLKVQKILTSQEQEEDSDEDQYFSDIL